MKPLRETLSDEVIARLRERCDTGEVGVSFELAMQFILTDGMLPASDLPVSAFLELEEWLRRQVAGA